MQSLIEALKHILIVIVCTFGILVLICATFAQLFMEKEYDKHDR